MSHRLAFNQVEFSRTGEAGAVRLTMPADLDILKALNAETMTVTFARELVAERRDAEKHQAEVLGFAEATGFSFEDAENFLAIIKTDFSEDD
jgi:hypothetical protein